MMFPEDPEERLKRKRKELRKKIDDAKGSLDDLASDSKLKGLDEGQLDAIGDAIKGAIDKIDGILTNTKRD